MVQSQTQSETARTRKIKTLVIIPTYNELGSLTDQVQGLVTSVPEVDILIVDDNSPDGTGQLADRLAQLNPRVSVLHRKGKGGLGPAYLAGFDYGIQQGYEFLVEMDADGSHRCEDLPKLLQVAPQADLVIGSRWIKGGKVVNWPLHRKAISRIGNIYAGLLLRAGVRDITAGFRVFRTSFLKSLDLSNIASQGYSFQVELAWKSKLASARIIEVPITFVERTQGNSKMSNKIVLEALWRVTKWGIGLR
ncbi:MAG: polyprenol monophosphomannose synthase [Micrococcales bacterium]